MHQGLQLENRDKWGLQGPGCALKALNCLKDFNFLRTSLTGSVGHGPPRAGLPNFNPARTGLKMANEYAEVASLQAARV